jgi:hypothetical protein
MKPARALTSEYLRDAPIEEIVSEAEDWLAESLRPHRIGDDAEPSIRDVALVLGLAVRLYREMKGGEQ